MLSLLQKLICPDSDILTSKLYDETTFYKKFVKDIENCESEIIIESPYITSRRMDMITPFFQNALKKGVEITIVTRNPRYFENEYCEQSEREINFLERIGINTILIDGNHHRKVAILDRKIVWEGSLNILSQNFSKEIMRRIYSERLAQQMVNFLKLY